MAHGLGERYELPLPLALFLSASGLVVLVSFLVMALFLGRGADLRRYPRLNLLQTRLGRALAARPVIFTLRLVALFFYLLVIIAGLFGEQRAFKNIAPVMVWAIAWIGFAYAAALIGNVWALVNPLDTLYRWAERLFRRRLWLGLRYPPALGQWPAVGLFLAFAWLELISESADTPATLAKLLLAYSALTWSGMLLFGREEWLQRGELFHVIYDYLSRFAPLEYRVVDGERQWNLRPYSVGLLRHVPLGASEIVLVVLILATVSFDGFLETPAWEAIAHHSGSGPAVLKSAGLIVALLVFLAAFIAACAAVSRLGGAQRSLARTAGLFVPTLVPIAIAYHVAHYLSFLLMASQYIGPLASDPLGRGWDLFGGGQQFIRLAVIDARTVWYVSVGAIVLGHVLAVLLAHIVALREFATRRAALRSQLPMVALMIAYTMTSLWIIAQPIVTAPR
jgi:hypothetical protein